MVQDIKTGYWLNVRHKPACLMRIMYAFTGDANISFEGNLSKCNFDLKLNPSNAETSELKRNTISPQQDFIILPLNDRTIPVILKQITPHGIIAQDIIHIQIEKNGNLVFGSYDNFHCDCVVVSSMIPQNLLEDLKEKGILRDYKQFNSKD